MLAQHLNIDEHSEPLRVIEKTGVECETLQRVAVIGSGPVGVRFAEEVLRYEPNTQVQLFGNEPFAPYNRVQLSSLLAGEIRREQINLPLPAKDKYPNFQFDVAHIKSINREEKCVIDFLGNKHYYDKLVIAAGARAHVPNIPGKDQQGVYRFRNLSDAESLFARVTRCRHVVVLGGGLLGLEAAKALSRAGTKVSVIQQGAHLMNRQLDEYAADLLRAEVERLGIRVYNHSGVREILGDGRVSGVRTQNNTEIKCDTVLMCAGIQANTELALKARLAIGRGIVVNDQLQTSDPDIFAIGECCEHEGKTYGLVNPGFEQAAVAASVVANGSARYHGSLAVSRLKVVGKNVFSMGEVVELTRRPLQKEIVYKNEKLGIYRKLILLKGKIIGAVGYGDWSEAPRIQTVFYNGFFIWPWQRILFRITGNLWFSDDSSDVSQWQNKATVCQCKGISKGELSSQVRAGAASVEALQSCTQAGTVCGSCKPLLAELVGSDQVLEKEKAWSIVLLSSVVAVLVAALVLALPEAQVSDSVQTQSWFESIWNDKFFKQVSGFSLLGLSALGLLMSMRKRFNIAWMGEFAYWRAAHALLGVLCASVLILHTGFHLGSNLNQILMFNFLCILLVGSVAGAVVSLSHRLKPARAKRLRKLWTWLHVLISWPLPALLAAHILTVYYF